MRIVIRAIARYARKAQLDQVQKKAVAAADIHQALHGAGLLQPIDDRLKGADPAADQDKHPR